MGEVCFGDRPWTIRKIAVCARLLPPDSAYHSYSKNAWWTQRDEWYATIIEMLHTQIRSLLALGGAKRIPEAISVPRPHAEPEIVVIRDIKQAFEYLHGN